MSRLRNWAHRRGIARMLNAEYSAGGYRRAYVQVIMPARWLARIAANQSWMAGHQLRRVDTFDRHGYFHWRAHVRR